MTKEQWNEVKEHWFTRIQFEFKIDGYNVVLQRGLSKNGKISYGLYVNGYQNLQWSEGKHEESKRFCQKRSKSYYTAKSKKEWMKILGKREYNKNKEKYEKKYIYYLPFWNNFNSFKKHIIANNKNIEYTNPLNDK